MGYRDTWIAHAYNVSRHSEVVLHAFDRDIPSKPIRLLDVGVENGGSLEVWQECLPEGSEIVGIDIEPRCAELGLPVLTGDVMDATWLREALRGQRFDVVVDSTGTMSPWTWPFLNTGGVMIYEGYDTKAMLELVYAVAEDKHSWLPVEEVMRVNVYPGVAVIEKRNPRVIPYIDIMVGNFADVTGEAALLREGCRWVLVN